MQQVLTKNLLKYARPNNLIEYFFDYTMLSTKHNREINEKTASFPGKMTLELLRTTEA